jgi:hypothetical protein
MVMCLLNGAILLLFPTGTPLIIPRLYLHDSIIEEITRWKKKICPATIWWDNDLYIPGFLALGARYFQGNYFVFI